MRTFLASILVWLLLASNAVAQFTGSTTTGQTSTVEQAQNARVDTYVTVTGCKIVQDEGQSPIQYEFQLF